MLAPKVLDLNAVVTENLKMLTRLIGEDIDLVMIPGAELGPVKADPSQIEQVIMNLAVNARDAMPQGGKLTIETANVTLDEAYARMHSPLKPGRLRDARHQRHRRRHGHRNPDSHLRTVLHHQGTKGNRPRPLHGVRHREAERRLHLGLQRARARAPRSRSICRA